MTASRRRAAARRCTCTPRPTSEATAGPTFSDDFHVAIDQGVDNRDDYTQGDFDWIDLPTPLETAHAANWKLSGYTDRCRSTRRTSSRRPGQRPPGVDHDPGDPGLRGQQLRDLPRSAHDPTDDTTILGYHGITALAYDQVGLTIENSWGPSWDDHGFVKIRWSWLADNLREAYDVGDLVHTTPPPPPPAPPVDNAPPAIGGAAEVGRTLSESHGDWTNSPTTYTYQWQRGDATGANFVDVAGKTGRSYDVTAADVGHTIRVEEWAGNAAGTGGPAASDADHGRPGAPDASAGAAREHGRPDDPRPRSRLRAR